MSTERKNTPKLGVPLTWAFDLIIHCILSSRDHRICHGAAVSPLVYTVGAKGRGSGEVPVVLVYG